MDTETDAAGPGTPDEWARFLAGQAPTAQTAALLEVLEADKLSHAGHIDALKALERHAAWIQAKQVRILAAVEADAQAALPEDGWDRRSEGEWNFAAEEVACALKVSNTTAGGRLEVARELDEHYPTTLGLLESGQICYMQARAVTEVCHSLDPALAAQVEAAVTPAMPGLATGQTRRALHRAVVKADPDGAEARHQVRRREREIVHWAGEDGMATWGAVLPAEQAAQLDQAIDTHAATLPDDDRTLAQKRVDALVDLVVHRPGGNHSGDGSAGGGRSAAVVQVTVPLDVLIGDSDDPADLKGYGPITATQARQVAFAEGTIWRRLITHPDTGMLVKTDPVTYRPTAETARHVIARDRHCTFPSCHMPAHRCDLDHIHPYNHHHPTTGGPTTPDNLTPLCRRHHRLKHTGNWTLTRNTHTGAITWTAPTGHTYTTHPHNYQE